MHPGVLPSSQGLYDPSNEHDACGVGFVAHIKGEQSHSIIQQGLTILERLHHRGAVGADPLAGDGAGLLMQISDGFFRGVVDFDLPEIGAYGIGMLFLPQDDAEREALETVVNNVIAEEGQQLLGWRTVPVDNAGLGETVYPTEPRIRQVFVGKGDNTADQTELERKLFIIHKRITAAITDKSGAEYFYINSMSTRTIVYKGMLLAGQVGEYYPDLNDERMVSALALVHQRFSTNTFPTWDLAHPFRMIAHNGEINTNQGNVNWMAARQHSMASDILGDDLEKIWPLIPAGQSDSACFDNALELLVAGGYSMTHAMMMLIPEAWGSNQLMDAKRRDFYEYHAGLMEPWDGPAAVAFTDGRQIGATLDRNGLRPARYLITDDDLVVLASEMGVLEIPEDKIVKKWRLQPGKMFLIDMEEGRIVDDQELKDKLASDKPYGEWLADTQIHVAKLADRSEEGTIPASLTGDALLNAQQAFGYTQEDMKFILAPMIKKGEEDLGSMGADNPQAVLSNRSRHLSNYFKQNFAQVTNPPIDPIREEIVMSLMSIVGPKPNLLGLNEAGSQKRLEVSQPVLSNTDLDKIRHITDVVGNDFRTKTLDITYDVSLGAEGMEAVIESLCDEAEKAVDGKYNILILSDRNISKARLTVPALLATSAVHQHLITKGLRTETGLVVETAAAVENHHFATLAGYGAEAINSWLVFETIEANLDTLAKGVDGLDVESAKKNYIKAVGKGLKKVMSKMGICTYQSYCGAQIFDAVGLKKSFIDKYFTGTSTMIEGIGLAEIS
ncbi:MAG TPA: glutamate synthase subunit alpha, partial [Thiothrix sp.]|nr:glutamate synthase subunit alpha [Thiothrix sp.]